MILKHGYAPPEQYQSDGRQGPWTDVYALSATMYRMLSGIVPQEATERVLAADKVEPLKRLVNDIPDHISAAIDHALKTDPGKRCGSVSDFAQELQSGPKKNRGLMIAISAAAVLLLLVGGILAFVLASGNKDKGNGRKEQTASVKDGETVTEPEEIKEEPGEKDEAEKQKPLTKEELLARISMVSDDPVVESLSGDYDGDGEEEVYAFCKDAYQYVLWHSGRKDLSIKGYYSDIGDPQSIVDSLAEEAEDPSRIHYEEDTTKPLQELSEDELLAKIKAVENDAELLEIKYDDYDGDGIHELFCISVDGQDLQNSNPNAITLSLWFADSRTVYRETIPDVWEGGIVLEDVQDFISNVVQFGKIKHYIVRYRNTRFTKIYETDMFGYEDGKIVKVGSITPDEAVWFERKGSKTYVSKQYYTRYDFPDVFSMSDWHASTAEFEVFYMNHQYYTFASFRVNEDFLYRFENGKEIISQVHEALCGSDTLPDTDILDKILYSGDDYIYMVYECWEDLNDKEYWDDILQGEDLSAAVDAGRIDLGDALFEQIPVDMRCAKIRVEDKRLVFEGIEEDDRLERGPFNNIYPNLVRFVEE